HQRDCVLHAKAGGIFFLEGTSFVARPVVDFPRSQHRINRRTLIRRIPRPRRNVHHFLNGCLDWRRLIHIHIYLLHTFRSRAGTPTTVKPSEPSRTHTAPAPITPSDPILIPC